MIAKLVEPCGPPAALRLSLIQPPPLLIPARFPSPPLHRDRADHHFRPYPIRQRPWRNIAALPPRSQQVLRCDRPRKTLNKLRAHNIDTSWFSAYLNNHTQSVSLTDRSGASKVLIEASKNIGVFQGSSLGPLLFSVLLTT